MSKYFQIEKHIRIPKVSHDFMIKYHYKILRIFAKMKDGDSVVLPFHPSTVYPICNGVGANIITRQVTISSWRFWLKYKEYELGDTITILDCEHNAINKGDKGTIIQVVPEIGYGVSVKKEDKEYEVFVDIDKVI